MKQNVFLCLLLMFSFNATAASTLVWNSSERTIESRGPSIDKSPSSKEMTVSVVSSADALDDGDHYVFSYLDDLDFSVQPSALVTSLTIIFDSARFNVPGSMINSSPVFSLLSGTETHREFSEVLENSVDQVLTLPEQPNQLLRGYRVEVEAQADAPVTLNAEPLPAAVWLFGSALLGVGGLSTRRRKPSDQI